MYRVNCPPKIHSALYMQNFMKSPHINRTQNNPIMSLEEGKISTSLLKHRKLKLVSQQRPNAAATVMLEMLDI